MSAILVLIASFVMVFFTVLIFCGIVLGLIAAVSHFVEWVVAPTADNDTLARRSTTEGLGGPDQ